MLETAILAQVAVAFGKPKGWEILSFIVVEAKDCKLFTLPLYCNLKSLIFAN